MKTFMRRFDWAITAVATCVGLVGGAGASQALATEANPPPRLTVELQDGSRIIGASVAAHFKFHSALLGDLKLDAKDIRFVTCLASNSVKVVTTRGDALSVSFADSELAVKTAFGKVELPVTLIRQFTVSMAFAPGAHPAGLVALWLGDGNGHDAAGKNDVSEMRDVTYGAGEFGPGFDFAGGDSGMTVPDAPELNFAKGQDFSIEAWIQPRRAPENSPPDELCIVSKRRAPNAFNYIGYAFYIAGGGQLYFLMGDVPMKMGGLIVNAGPDLRDGKFHQVAVTISRNQPAGGHLYVDGEQVLTFDPTPENGDLSNPEPLLIGYQKTPGYATPFKGMMNGLSIYRRALSADEIRSEYGPGNAP